MAIEWTAQKERSNPFALRLICWIALHLSREFVRHWLWPITVYYFITSPQVRYASRCYLRRIPGYSGTSYEVICHLHHFSAIVLDRIYFLTDKFSQFEVEVHGEGILDAAIAQGKGVLLLGAHVGSFELLRCLAIRRKNLPLKILMNVGHNAMITRILENLNPRVASSVINLVEPSALLQMKEALEQKYLVGMLGDRVLADERQVNCILLGDEIAMPAGPFTLAEILNVPVVSFIGIYKGGNRYTIHFTMLSEVQTVPRPQREATVARLMQKYVDGLEAMLLRYPLNWFNFYDYWGEGK